MALVSPVAVPRRSAAGMTPLYGPLVRLNDAGAECYAGNDRLWHRTRRWWQLHDAIWAVLDRAGR